MLIGYARVSTQDQDPQMQVDALSKAGCDKIYTERASGAKRSRPELMAALDYAREGDTIVVWKLDRMARSLKQLIETVEELEGRGVGFSAFKKPRRPRGIFYHDFVIGFFCLRQGHIDPPLLAEDLATYLETLRRFRFECVM